MKTSNSGMGSKHGLHKQYFNGSPANHGHKPSTPSTKASTAIKTSGAGRKTKGC